MASQAVGFATGIQEKFSFKGVALSALSAGVTYGLGPNGGIFKGEGGAFSGVAKSTALQAGLRGATASAISQGIGTVTCLQSSFSWAGVPAAGVAAGVGDAFGLDALSGKDANLTPGNIASHTAVGAARLFASAATRSAITGSSFGGAVEAGVPDVIEQVVGQVIGGAFISAIDADPVSAPPLKSFGSSADASGRTSLTGFQKPTGQYRNADTDDITPAIARGYAEEWRRNGAEFGNSTADIEYYAKYWDRVAQGLEQATNASSVPNPNRQPRVFRWKIG
ncbi:MAG: hypothetical protein AAF559_04120 [Pseudomonadota bacterium]